jgi:PIN domain nuclease of toxin-antitoxin system
VSFLLLVAQLNLETWRNGSRKCLLNIRAKSLTGSSPVVSAISIWELGMRILDWSVNLTNNPKSPIQNRPGDVA